jgi:hypothetical protein
MTPTSRVPPPLPAGDQGPPLLVAGERDTLLAFIGYLRERLLAKCAGLDEDAARHSPVPSGTSLMGLVKHVAAVEAFRVRHRFAGGPVEVIPADAVTDADTVRSVTDGYRAVAASVDEIVRACPDLDREAARVPLPLRWVLIHLVEEIGRHAGHADIIREQIDGTAGR